MGLHHCRKSQPACIHVKLVRQISSEEMQEQKMKYILHPLLCWQCQGLGGHYPWSHSEGPLSIPDQFMWDVWLTRWQWENCFFDYFDFDLSAQLYVAIMLMEQIHSPRVNKRRQKVFL
jgi:hypothetical protein